MNLKSDYIYTKVRKNSCLFVNRAINRYSNIFLGLYGAVVKNPEITEIVLDMLLAHLNIYLETDVDVLPPVKFELCADYHGTEVVLQEPIAEMIFALQKIYIDTIPKKSNTLDKLRDILESLCTRMASTELEHLNLVIETLISKVHSSVPYLSIVSGARNRSAGGSSKVSSEVKKSGYGDYHL